MPLAPVLPGTGSLMVLSAGSTTDMVSITCRTESSTSPYRPAGPAGNGALEISMIWTTAPLRNVRALVGRTQRRLSHSSSDHSDSVDSSFAVVSSLDASEAAVDSSGAALDSSGAALDASDVPLVSWEPALGASIL